MNNYHACMDNAVRSRSIREKIHNRRMSQGLNVTGKENNYCQIIKFMRAYKYCALTCNACLCILITVEKHSTVGKVILQDIGRRKKIIQ